MEERHLRHSRLLSVGRNNLVQREIRLRRLERMLAERASRLQAREERDTAPAQSRRRDGFTLIELLIVLAVAAVILSIGIGSLSRSLQSRAAEAAVSDISRANDIARQLSMQSHDGDQVYGVRLADDPSDGATVTVIHLHNGRIEDAQQSSTNELLYKVQLPEALVLWHRDQTLRSTNTTLSWFFAAKTGALREYRNGKLMPYAVTVGCPERSVRRQWDQDNHTGTAPAIASGNEDHPGLHLATISKTNRIAFGVFSSGIFFQHTIGNAHP